jgi:hypothetical protein
MALDEEMKLLLSQLDKLPDAKKMLILEDLDRREKMMEKELARTTYM